MSADERDVCSGDWRAASDTYLTLINTNQNPVVVYPSPGFAWPFHDPHNSFIVPAEGANGVPGERTVRVVNMPGEIYAYNTSGCPGDPKGVNPKNIVIT